VTPVGSSLKTFTVRGGVDLRAYLELFKYHAGKTATFAAVDYAGIVNGAIPALESQGPKPVTEAEVLEIGCGQRATATLILHTLGAQVIGIDYDYAEAGFSWRGLLTSARENGLQRAAKNLVRHAFFDRKYYAEIERLIGRPLLRRNVDIRRMDACHLELPDDSIDYVVSHSVFEHVHDVPAAAAELRRVLRPGGIARLSIHLFPCLSGGHRMEWAYPDEQPSATIPPWDHLRERRFPPHVYLNELRESDYRSIFSRHFEIVDSSTTSEGEDLLTPELARELSDYSFEDLTHANLMLLLK
jgi:SAM-dependent methyltransferase